MPLIIVAGIMVLIAYAIFSKIDDSLLDKAEMVDAREIAQRLCGTGEARHLL